MKSTILTPYKNLIAKIVLGRTNEKRLKGGEESCFNRILHSSSDCLCLINIVIYSEDLHFNFQELISAFRAKCFERLLVPF